MKFFKKSSILLTLLICLSLVVSACGGGSDNSNANSGTGETNTGSDEKIDLTLMFAWPDDEVAKKEEELIQEKFGDKYNITFKPVDHDIERTIKTTISAGNPVDLAFHWMTDMETFVNADMALDLTPYLEENDDEWKNTFADGSLDQATYDGKTYAVPAVPVYPLILANEDLLDEAGVTISDQPTWEEFTTALAEVKEELDITPFGIMEDWAEWLVVNGLFGIWETEEKALEWAQGEISFYDSNVVEVFDEVKKLYDNEYIYPGQGALTITQDEVINAFKAEEIVFMANINHTANDTVELSGLDNVQVISFPHMGPRTKVMGTANGYMIPANVKHPEASIEILKYLTSEEVLQHRADSGSPVSIKGVETDNPLVELYSKDAGNLYTLPQIKDLSSELENYLGNNMPANYIFDPEKTLEELEKLRLEAIE